MSGKDPIHKLPTATPGYSLHKPSSDRASYGSPSGSGVWTRQRRLQINEASEPG